MSIQYPLARDPFGEPAGFKFDNLRKVVFPGSKMSEAHNLEIRTVSGMIILPARQLPLAVEMANGQFYRSLRPKDVPTYDSSCVRL